MLRVAGKSWKIRCPVRDGGYDDAVDAILAELERPSEGMVEAAAVAFCMAEGRDPHQMTYITDDGIQQPYGSAYQWYVEPMRDAISAMIRAAREGK